MGVDLTGDMLKGMDGISQHRDGDYIFRWINQMHNEELVISGYKSKVKKVKRKMNLKYLVKKLLN